MLLHRWSPRDVPQAEMTSQRRGILIGIATYKLPGARCPPPYPLIQEYHAYTRHHHHHCPLPPIKHSQSMQLQTCLQCVCNLFGLHPYSRPLSPSSPSLLSFYLLSLYLSGSGSYRFQAVQRANRWRRSPGAPARLRCGEPGRPGYRVQQAGPALSRRPIRSGAPPGSPAHSFTPASSCSAILPSPRQTGPPPRCTPEF